MKLFLLLLLLLVAQKTLSSEIVIDTTITGKDTFMVYTTYNEDGNVVKVDRYKNWELHGVQEEFYENGNIISRIVYENNCPIDTLFSFYKDNSLRRVTPYYNCEIHGHSIRLAPDGDTLAANEYRDGQLIGVHKLFFENNKLWRIDTYNNEGQRHGLRETWREDGTRKDSIVYDNGEIIELRTYFLNGKVRNWTRVKDGRQDSVIFYDPEGNITGKIENGSGKAIRYSEDTTIRWFEVFEDGFRIDSRELEPGENPSLD
ncbi:hypothetical protein QA601_15520 [Chitinispirillales bacterium ANBcel5]|uniref:toxin-antitoxin system YwqK family antitoxin n=1 Tax=Cellulosispirillum alkaliphilum TaxID=3039283 RepID=UPI002A5452B0|nr:hypothetical protein [Chitinispirillales bacterium ANBcel5]